MIYFFVLVGLLLSGFAAFIPKFIESQFSVSSGWAAMLVGKCTLKSDYFSIPYSVTSTSVSSIQYPVSSVQCPLFSIQFSNPQYSMFSIMTLFQTLSIQFPTLTIPYPIFSIQYPVSSMRCPLYIFSIQFSNHQYSMFSIMFQILSIQFPILTIPYPIFSIQSSIRLETFGIHYRVFSIHHSSVRFSI